VKVQFTEIGWAHYISWVGEPRMMRRINRLIEEASRDPSLGIGKPEPLSENYAGYWSRRITDEHRLIYAVDGDVLTVIQARYHY
jgi:toxin YoeB